MFYATTTTPSSLLPSVALTDVIESAEATLTDYINNEWSSGSVEEGDMVKLTTGDVYVLTTEDGDEANDWTIVEDYITPNSGWSTSNVSSDKVIDADSTTLNEVADVLGTVVDTLKTQGIFTA